MPLSQVQPVRPIHEISRNFTSELAHWMAKGLPTADSKRIQEESKVNFESASFSILPPSLDDWIARRLKSQASHKTVEAAEKL